MKKVLYTIAILAICFAGCSKNDEPEVLVKEENNVENEIEEQQNNSQPQLQHIEIKVRVENPQDNDTKATLPSTMVTFGAGDAIAVIGTKDATAEVITLTVTKIDKGIVTFSTDIDSDYTIGNYAYYPATIATTTERTINWPTEIDGAKVQVPMIAYLDAANETCVFKHLGAIAQIAVADCPGGATKLKFTAASNITGPYTVNDFTTGTPSVTPGDLTGKTITADIDSDGTYYIPLPAASSGTSYSGFQFALINDTDTYYYKQRTAKKTVGPFNRKQIVNFGTLTYDVDVIKEWYMICDINSWLTSATDLRLIKTGASTYSISTYVYYINSNNPWYNFYDGSNSYGVPTESTGTLSQGQTCKRDVNEVFTATLTQSGESWILSDTGYGGSDWDRCWDVDDVHIYLCNTATSLSDGTKGISLSKTDINNNMLWYNEGGLVISDNASHDFAFYIDGGGWNGWQKADATPISLTDAKPYAQAIWGGANNMSYTLTAGTYNVYYDVKTLNFMFVKQ